MRILALIIVLLVTGCASGSLVEPRVPADLDETFTLRVGQTATFGDERLQLGFDGVAEDSRCPAGVVCVWQGNARVRLHLSDGSATRLVELNTGVDPRSAAELGYRIQLVALDPPTEANRPTQPDRYRATLVVSRDP